MQAPIDFTPPHNGTATSREAAESVRPHTSRLRETVLQAIRDQGRTGLSSDEAELLLGMSHQSCSARINELAKAGLIVTAGRRPTRSGRSAFIWITR